MKILIIVDTQNDFIDPTNGTLVAPNAESVVFKINELTKSDKFDVVIATQDWHPKNHVSFASRYNVPPFSLTENDMVWPDHCIQGTWGAELHSQLDQCGIDMIIRKGTDIDVDSYSALFDNVNGNGTPLVNYLASELEDLEGLSLEVFVCGIATDVCVINTINDLLDYSNQIDVTLIVDASAATTKKNQDRIIHELKSTTVKLLDTKEVLK